VECTFGLSTFLALLLPLSTRCVESSRIPRPSNPSPPSLFFSTIAFGRAAARCAAPKLPRVIRVGPNANLRIDNPYGLARNLGVDNLFAFSRISGSKIWSESIIRISKKSRKNKTRTRGSEVPKLLRAPSG